MEEAGEIPPRMSAGMPLRGTPRSGIPLSQIPSVWSQESQLCPLKAEGGCREQRWGCGAALSSPDQSLPLEDNTQTRLSCRKTSTPGALVPVVMAQPTLLPLSCRCSESWLKSDTSTPEGHLFRNSRFTMEASKLSGKSDLVSRLLVLPGVG